MAVTEEGQTDERSFVLEGARHRVEVVAPLFFFDLLGQTLTGWSIQPLESCDTPDLTIRKDGDDYVITSILAKPVPVRRDLIDALNEVFLCLSYLITARTFGAYLLHCAAFRVDGVNILVFGKKNAGKSSLMLEKARQGATILADDLMIWLPQAAEVMCVGLPLRMRRPVLGLDHGAAVTPQFIAGRQTAYAQKDVFQIAKAGLSFTPDKICQLQNRQLVPVPFMQWPRVIAKHRISDDCITLSAS